MGQIPIHVPRDTQSSGRNPFACRRMVWDPGILDRISHYHEYNCPCLELCALLSAYSPIIMVISQRKCFRGCLLRRLSWMIMLDEAYTLLVQCEHVDMRTG